MAWRAERTALRQLVDTLTEQLHDTRAASSQVPTTTHMVCRGRDAATASVHQAYAATGLRPVDNAWRSSTTTVRGHERARSREDESVADVARLRAQVVDLQRQMADAVANRAAALDDPSGVAGRALSAQAVAALHARLLWVEAHSMEAALQEAREETRKQVRVVALLKRAQPFFSPLLSRPKGCTHSLEA